MSAVPSTVGDTMPLSSRLGGVAPEPSHRGFQAMQMLRARLVPAVAEACSDRYRFKQRLGEGGLGVVYAAYDPQLDRDVAIKVLHPEITERDGRRAAQRLIREGRAMARLAHPNVVEVFDIGEHERGAFVVMEQLAGCTLADWLRVPHRFEEVLRVMRDAGEGLVAAHDVGLVHRDFKPANVFVCTGGHVKVLDFGLARAYQPSQSDHELTSRDGASLQDGVTETGVVLGTPSYMAPEQHRGQEADARSDQYAFCVTLFRAAHGVMPFFGRGAAEMLTAKLAMKLTPSRSAAELPRRIDDAIRRGLSPDPADRWPSMRELLAQLSPRQRRRNVIAGMGALALGGLLAAVVPATAMVGGSTKAEIAEAPPPDQAVLDRANALRGKAQDQTDAGELAGAVRTASELIALGEQTDNAGFVVGGLHDRARALLLSGKYEDSSSDAIRSALAAEAAGDDSAQLRAASLALAGLAASGRYDEAKRWSRTVDALIDRVEDEGQLLAESLGSQAALLRNLGDPTAARQRYERALAIADADPDIDPYTVAATLSGIASTAMDLGEYEASYQAYLRSAAAFRALLGDEHTATATVTMNLGTAALNAGRPDEARTHLLAARAVLQRVTAPDADHVPFCDHSLAIVAEQQHDPAEALASFERAREGFRRAHGDEHPTLVRTNIGISNALGAVGRLEDSLRAAQRARRMAESLFDEDHPTLGYATQAVGRVQAALQRPEATQTLRTALTILRAASVPTVEVGRAEFELARALWTTPSSHGQALALAESALSLTDGAHGQPSLHDDVQTWLHERKASRPR